MVRMGDRHGLSPRERKVLGWPAEGLRNSRMADVLFLSERDRRASRPSVLRNLGGVLAALADCIPAEDLVAFTNT
jgi:FixJ family two-component response regulator